MSDVAVPAISDTPQAPRSARRRVFITVAEVSGDQHAAHLIRELKSLDPDIYIEGIGGPEMRAAGAVIHHETVGRAAMGLSGAKRALEVYGLLRWTRQYFQNHKPDLQICCDSPAMNFHFAKLAREFCVPVLYYIAPQLWAWREGRMKKLRKWVDHVACILPFEEEYFRRHGVKATFVGHPLFDGLPTRQEPAEPNDFKTRAPIVGLLPGSRRGEAQKNFPPMLDVAEQIRAAFPNVKFLVPTTAATDPIVRSLVKRSDPITIGLGEFDQMVPQCDFCVTVSGTATLHVAGYHVPMLVVYRFPRALWHLFGRWLVRTRTYSLVNLLADTHQHIVPEFIPWFGSPDPVAKATINFLKEPNLRKEQTEKLQHLIRTLDKPGASLNVARLAMKLMEGT